ncbi:MAG: Vi polysaccharide biosynthesis UDP-N-acetylglucosamine C-6 dehydrogenase TviB, partial [Candidatus Electrothrix sp. AR3]|nr:Vi polysaccharide biosynthesis UDP-N-acetylglucosamine C-6 dehydrogenase TviB [Candidatus Electrothrix sp. AR3]
CIGVDPYYLTHKAQETGYHPEIILAGRRINDAMGEYIVSQVIKLILRKQITLSGARVLILGMTFKENCPDIRNTKVVDVIREFTEYNIEVAVYDPWVDKDEVRCEYGIDLLDTPAQASFDAIVLCVAHDEFKSKGIEWIKNFGKDPYVLYDVKNILPNNEVDGSL